MARSTLCPCLSGRTLGRCCGPYEHIPDPDPSPEPAAIHRSFRNHLMALIRDSSALTELWFAFLDHWNGEADPSQTALDSVLLDHFLWDWFQRYPEARPLCRIVQAMESVDLRMSSHISIWADSPLEPWAVERIEKPFVQLRRLHGNRTIEVLPSFPLGRLRIGEAILARTLPHRGVRVLGLGGMRLPPTGGTDRLKHLYASVLEAHGLAPTVTLRPDVHSSVWYAIHDDLIRALRGLDRPGAAPDVSTNFDLDQPREELAGQSPRQAASHELGRLRLRKWAASRPESERKALEDLFKV